VNKIEVRAGMRNPSPGIVKLCENAVYGRLRAPDCHLNLAWGKWMLQCTQGRAKKLCASVVCVTICKFFHGMTGKLKQLATEKGPAWILMRG
jgi:hypothetical protein